MTGMDRRTFLKLAAAAGLSLWLRRLVRAGREGAASFVLALWSGALTPQSARVNARIDHDSSTVRLRVSTNPDLSNPQFSNFATADLGTNNRMVALPINGLTPGTQYYYGVESAGVLDDTTQGRFRTPLAGAQSFTFAFASCANTGSTHAVFDTIRQQNPLFFLHTGDMHYENIAVNDPALFRAAFDAVMTAAPQAALYQSLPIAYMWDDHDYGPNDSDSTSPGRLAARLTYQEYAPHYPLAAGSGDVPIYQAFTIGRIRFILTDLRSERSPKTDPDNASKTMMGAAQKAWFKNELLAASGRYAAIIWLSTTPWIGAASAGADFWAGYTTERQELADFMKDNGIGGVIMLCGDAHMIAIDDGTNTDYASGGGAAFPLMHAAALDRSGIVLGGPYSHGAFPGPGQFGLFTVNDDGGEVVSFTMSGRDVNNSVVVEYSFSWPCCPDLERTYLPAILNS